MLFSFRLAISQAIAKCSLNTLSSSDIFTVLVSCDMLCVDIVAVVVVFTSLKHTLELFTLRLFYCRSLEEGLN